MTGKILVLTAIDDELQKARAPDGFEVIYTGVGKVNAASAATLATAFLAPAWLAPLNRAWFKLALLLNRVVSPVVMFVIYAGVIVPFGLVMQLLRDPLAAKRPERASHWIDRSQSSPMTSMRDQF